jgi:Leucine-rich repeat (LRR) protein
MKSKLNFVLYKFRMIASVLLVACIVPTMAAPSLRKIDNTIDTRNMPHEIKQTFPSLLEITKKLTKIYASGNQMKLTSDVFANADHLEMINLSDGDLKEIESRAFYGPAKLRKLDLSGNKLTTLPNDLFPRGIPLKEIDLSNNQINQLSRGTFRNLNSLKKLDLRNNNIAVLDGPIFADLTNLDEIDLSGNPIRTITEEFFASLPNGLQLTFDDHHLDFKSSALTEQWAL